MSYNALAITADDYRHFALGGVPLGKHHGDDLASERVKAFRPRHFEEQVKFLVVAILRNRLLDESDLL
ncbi:hypothetical protein AGR5A_Cc10034 [Agrobacterium genomosp. 5 str. CFBP 6626]|nr:hypothetical protein AGR5A_Cc10034 [Agrobacterium genomosp. 5 str. CFBP 6626]